MSARVVELVVRVLAEGQVTVSAAQQRLRQLLQEQGLDAWTYPKGTDPNADEIRHMRTNWADADVLQKTAIRRVRAGHGTGGRKP